MNLLRQAVARVEAGESLALVTVIAVRGSSPRHVGAQMLVTPAGATTSTIGGGRVEQEMAGIAAQVAAGAPARQVRQDLESDLAGCCGSSMEFYVEPVAPSLPALRQALTSWDARRPAQLVTVFDGRPKTLELLPKHDRRQPFSDAEKLLEPIWPRDRVVLFGAGHVARAIGPLAVVVDFEVVICDDNRTGALTALGPSEGPDWAKRMLASFAVRDVEAELGPLGVGDYVLIVTRDHDMDERILEQLLPNQALSYLGLIGSRAKVRRIRERLAAKGVATADRWARLRAPIGLALGAETPAEIAVAVVAQLVYVRRRGGRSPLDYALESIEPDSESQSLSARD